MKTNGIKESDRSRFEESDTIRTHVTLKTFKITYSTTLNVRLLFAYRKYLTFSFYKREKAYILLFHLMLEPSKVKDKILKGKDDP